VRLPRRWRSELFRPFIYNKLEKEGLVTTIKAAKEMVEQQAPRCGTSSRRSSREHRCC